MNLLFISALVSLFSYPKLAFAIPPPETMALIGGSIIPPVLFILGLLTILFNYLWVKTKLFIAWRLYLPHLVAGFGICMAIILLLFSFYTVTKSHIHNTAISPEEVAQWQKSSNPPLIIDIRGEKYYRHIHLANAVSIPERSQLPFFLEKNLNKKIVLYCKLGVQSTGYDWLINTPISEKDFHGKPLYYFPGGLKALLSLGAKNPFPVVMNIEPEYAHYLLKQPQFVLFNLPEHLPVEQQIATYKKWVAQGNRPIMNYSPTHIQLSESLSKLGVKEFIFIMSQASKSLVLKLLIPPISIVFILLYLIRQREFFKSLSNHRKNYYLYLSTLLCMMVTLPCFYLVIKYPIPFDLELFVVNANLPMNLPFLVMCYAAWSVCVFANLQCPRKIRLALLHQHILSRVTRIKPNNRIPLAHIPRNFLLTALSTYLIYCLEVPLQAVFFISLFLFIPLVIDCIFYIWHMIKPLSALKLVSQISLPQELSAPTDYEWDTYHETSLGKIGVRVGQQIMTVGLFSGKPLQPYPNEQFKKIKLQEQCQLIRRLLFIFQQDIKISFNQKNGLQALYLYHNSNHPCARYRTIFLMQEQLYQGDINATRFTAERFQEGFDAPTPLMIDVLNHRWDKQGGCIKALRKLGYFIHSTPEATQQLIGLSHRIYLDEAIEKSLFAAGKMQSYFRKKLVPIACKLAWERLVYDYYGFILPRVELRLLQGIERLNEPMSVNQLKHLIRRTIAHLYQSKWQCYSSLLHQQFYNEMHEKSDKLAGSGLSLPIPQRYSFSVSEQLIPEKHLNLEQVRFFTAERFRSNMRNLQLKEWQYLGLLLDKLKNKLNLPINLYYLLIDELQHLPKQRTSLIQLLQERYQQWTMQNTLNLPTCFSLHDLEHEFIPAHFDTQHTFTPLRVAGNQPKIVGIAVPLEADLELQHLPEHSILIAENLLPEQLINCQHLRAVLLAKGSALSHTSIIAREKNINLIVFYPINTIKHHDKLLIEGAQVRQIQTSHVQWDFLDAVSSIENIGNKAQRLKILGENKFNIPFSLILYHDSIQTMSQQNDEQIKEDSMRELHLLLDLFDAPQHGFILRSSTSFEDSKEYSYAGLFHSNRVTNTDELMQHINRAWQKKEEILKLLPQYSAKQAKIFHALLLQPFLQGTCGGILFTTSAYPEHMHVEISISGAEGVAQGNQLHSSFYLDKNGQSHYQQGQKIILTHNQLTTLYHLGRSIEALFGCPQDIEWVLLQDTFYILQSRDITTFI